MYNKHCWNSVSLVIVSLGVFCCTRFTVYLPLMLAGCSNYKPWNSVLTELAALHDTATEVNWWPGVWYGLATGQPWRRKSNNGRCVWLVCIVKCFTVSNRCTCCYKTFHGLFIPLSQETYIIHREPTPASDNSVTAVALTHWFEGIWD